MNFAEEFIEESIEVLKRIDPLAVEASASGLAEVRERGGRLFGVGGSPLNGLDGLLVLSVGGGDAERGISANLVAAMEFARACGASIFAIVGRDGGFAAKVADNIVLIPPLYPERVTPHTEGLCAVIWHLLVTHPLLARQSAKWEGLK